MYFIKVKIFHKVINCLYVNEELWIEVWSVSKIAYFKWGNQAIARRASAGSDKKFKRFGFKLSGSDTLLKQKHIKEKFTCLSGFISSTIFEKVLMKNNVKCEQKIVYISKIYSLKKTLNDSEDIADIKIVGVNVLKYVNLASVTLSKNDTSQTVSVDEGKNKNILHERQYIDTYLASYATDTRQENALVDSRCNIE